MRSWCEVGLYWWRWRWMVKYPLSTVQATQSDQEGLQWSVLTPVRRTNFLPSQCSAQTWILNLKGTLGQCCVHSIVVSRTRPAPSPVTMISYPRRDGKIEKQVKQYWYGESWRLRLRNISRDPRGVKCSPYAREHVSVQPQTPLTQQRKLSFTALERWEWRVGGQRKVWSEA